tara:strand:+ start:88 stop:1047 length:960 start_codon:yes stop_codon:yes gene_type:complete
LATATAANHCRECSIKLCLQDAAALEREPEVQALLEAHPVLKRAPVKAADAVKKQPYVQLDRSNKLKPRIVVAAAAGGGKFQWMAGCIHGCQLQACKECLSTEAMATKKHWCRGCPTVLSTKKRKLLGLCATCDDGQTKVARTEIRLRDTLFAAVGHEPSAVDDTYFGTERDLCNVDRSTRPDALWLGKEHAVICETDENSHMNDGYLPACDARWATDMATSIEGAMRKAGLDGGQTRIFIVRWNPDARDRDRPRIGEEDRARIVGTRVKALLKMPAEELAKFPPAVPILIYYFYHSKAQDRIDYARGCDGIVVHDVID